MQKEDLMWREVLEERVEDTQRNLDQGKICQANRWFAERNLEFSKQLLSMLNKGKPIIFKHNRLHHARKS